MARGSWSLYSADMVGGSWIFLWNWSGRVVFGVGSCADGGDISGGEEDGDIVGCGGGGLCC